MPVTLKRLARELGLHHSTVAYALSGKGTVKEATRQRVRETAAQLGYVPNGLARRMRARRTNVIGLVVPDVLITYNDFIQQTFRIAHERGFDAQIALTEFASDLEDQAVRFLMESRVDGVILRSRFNRWDDVPAGHTLRQLQAQRVPTISYGVPIEGSSFPCLALPIHRQGEVLAQHLLQLRHKQLAWLMPVPGPLFKPQHRHRVEGTAAALRAAGMDPGALQVICLSPEEAEEVNGHDASHQDYLREALPRSGVRRGRQLMRKAMALSPRPTAVLCLHEATAIGAIVEAQAMGLRVPQDVAVAASARGAAADVAPMSLTTADVSPQQAARLALELLLDTIRRHESTDGSIEKSTHRFELDAVLVVGHSTQG